MDTNADRTPTVTAILADPLVKLVMRSDNVSEADLSALINRLQRTLAQMAHAQRQPPRGDTLQ